MIKTHFVFAVSFVAMMAVSAALASAPTGNDSVGDPHEVYEATELKETSGIAGVSYVNRVVGEAGASAQAAEAHAAAAGQAALDAAASAAAANEALKSKADKKELEDYATTDYVDGQITTVSGPTAALSADVEQLKSDMNDLSDIVDGKQASLGYTAENSANKVTSVSSTSTDTEYPSAQAVYMAFIGMQAKTQPKSDKDFQMGNASGGWTAMTKAQQDALNSTVTTTTVTQVATNATNIAKKQDTLVPNTNIKGSGSVTVTKGTDGVITINGTDANTTYSTGTADTAGLTKLYTGTGTATDGTMTQAALKTALDGKLSTSGTAAKATADANGNNIVNTYATKTEMNTGLSGKQATLTTSNIKGAGSVSVAISDGVITVSGTDNNTTYGTGNTTTSGLTKLYTGTGAATDGTMTQAALKTALDGKLSTSGTAAKATADANGNNIVNTYATKAYVDGQITTVSGPTAALSADVEQLKSDLADLDGTAVTHTANTAAGTTTRPVYVTTAGVATEVSGISVPVKSGTSTTSWAEIWVE